VTGPNGSKQVPAGTPTQVTVTGTNLDPKATYTFGNGISVTGTTANADGSIILQVTPDATAAIGPRTIIVINTDCSAVTLADAIEVTAAPKLAPAPAPTPSPVSPRPARPVAKKPSDSPNR
jgi:hypothetical protein